MHLLSTILALLPATYVLAQGTTINVDNTTIGDNQTIDLNSLASSATATADATSASSTGGVGPMITAAPLALAGVVGFGVLQGVL